jgi:CfrBI-like restriction endonuclease
LSAEQKAVLNWEFMVQLMTIIGSQTLVIRGSDKSGFGKLFEKLILGTLLKVLGFKMVSPQNITQTDKVFWLSERADKRESDVTVLYEKGRGIRFDIGFIGRGNPEISLDKVSRFEREIELGRQKYSMAAIIIVDRIGAGSRIETLAKAINGHIVQMSGAYWPIKVAMFLKDTLGYQDKMLEQNERTIDDYLKDKIKDIGIEELFDIPDFDQPITKQLLI